LVRAAQMLMGRKGVHATSIQEITEAADVGFGSFFNHFTSKEAIADAVMQDAVAAFGAASDRMARSLTDPAEVLSASIRHAVRRAAADEPWGRFLVRTAFTRTGGLRHELGRRLERDVQRGVAARRLAPPDLDAATLAAGGAVVACIAAMLAGELDRDAPERTATVVLQILGLPAKEAAQVARRSLPPLDDAPPEAPPTTRRSRPQRKESS
jgi:AcrR family transcriptional regulator